MTQEFFAFDVPKGHPRGGPFVAALTLTLIGLATSACGSAASTRERSPAHAAPRVERLPNPLRFYRELDFITGDQRFPVVGRFVFLPGPADSTYAILAVSLPNNALRFRREDQGFLARYKVELQVGDSLAPEAQLSETQIVRVRSFRETSRRDESVIFQGFLKLRPGSYPTRLLIADLSSTARLKTEVDLAVPHFEPPAVSAPVIVYRAEPRSDRAARPNLIINPRATVEMGGGDPLAYLEWLADSASQLLLIEAGEQVWADSAAANTAQHFQAAVLAIDGARLAPGALTLRTNISGSASSESSTILVALLSDWLVRDYDEVMSYLRYAGTPAYLDSLRKALPGERARLLQSFWRLRDSVPETPENEFFERYFRRIQEANDRFIESATPGWLTDRGAVYVTLGPPDEVLREIELRADGEPAQVWLYRKSLGFDLRLTFVDRSGLGSYSLTADSRRAFRRAVQTVYR